MKWPDPQTQDEIAVVAFILLALTLFNLLFAEAIIAIATGRAPL